MLRAPIGACLEKYNSLCWTCTTREWLQRREGQMEKMACIHCCLCLGALLVLGIPPTARQVKKQAELFQLFWFLFPENLTLIRVF